MKTFLINLLIVLAGLIVVELVFGSWFRKQNQLERNLQIEMDRIGYYPLKGLYKSDNDIIKYSRDQYGLRGELSWNHPEKIDILTIGGSTTAQRTITDGLTWQDVLQNELMKDNKNMIISNAGIDGRTTIGHIKDFEMWFPQIPDLSPKYILFYIGINDLIVVDNDIDADLYSFDNEYIKQNSAIWNLLRRIQGALLAKTARANHASVNFSQVKYIDKGVKTEEEFGEYKRKADVNFRNRLLRLIELTEAMGAEPVFITQTVRTFKYTEDQTRVGAEEFGGIDYYNMLNELNKIIYEVAGDKYIVVELTELRIWEDGDFYDFFHNTPSGAQKIGVEIYKQIKDKIN